MSEEERWFLRVVDDYEREGHGARSIDITRREQVEYMLPPSSALRRLWERGYLRRRPARGGYSYRLTEKGQKEIGY